VLHTFAAHIRARPQAVFEALDARLYPGDGASSAYLADASAFLIVTQGGWWYRAEYRVVPDERGSNLEHVVVNVAQRGEKAALAAGRRVIADAPLAFHDLVKGLRGELE
jgi:hypothetical protein